MTEAEKRLRRIARGKALAKSESIEIRKAHRANQQVAGLALLKSVFLFLFFFLFFFFLLFYFFILKYIHTLSTSQKHKIPVEDRTGEARSGEGRASSGGKGRKADQGREDRMICASAYYRSCP